MSSSVSVISQDTFSTNKRSCCSYTSALIISLNYKVHKHSCFIFVFAEYKIPASCCSCEPLLTDQCGSAWQKTYCNFHKSALKSPKTSNFLSYFCYGAGRGCGGLGNRIQGLVSLFYLAMLTNRTFLIHWDGPGKLEEYLEPNQIAWTLPLSSLGQFRKTYWGVSGPQSGYQTNRIESETQFANWTSYADFDAYLGRFHCTKKRI